LVVVVVPMSPLPVFVFWLLVMAPPCVAPPVEPLVPALDPAEPLLCIPLAWAASLCGSAEASPRFELLELLVDGVVLDCELLPDCDAADCDAVP
jgi:hypothetical protein